MTTLRPSFRFALGGLVLGGILNLMATGVALGEDRAPSSLTNFSSPGLKNAIRYSSHSTQNPSINDMKWMHPVSEVSQSQTTAQSLRTNQLGSAPIEPNSFPPMIAKIRTQNWDE